jgi:glycine/D-amino acid oxidase-like deaminating enzyme
MSLELPDSPLSLWLETYGDYSPSPALEGERDVDVAIIGGGFTGMASAYELERAEPGLRVALLEAKTVGYGASGRNGSFAMTVVGLGFGPTAKLRGKAFLRDAHRYMMRAVDDLDALITRERIDCDRIRPGFLRMATTDAYVRRLQEEVELMSSLGFDDISWLNAQEARSRVDSKHYLGAMWEPRLLLINPAKLVRAEKALVERLGVEVFENTPVLEICSGNRFSLRTPGGRLNADKLVFATNAYSHGFVELRRKQIPAFTYMIATEPLTDVQFEPIGWRGREGIEDARNLIHYYRVTPDDRLVIGGGPVGLSYGGRLDADRDENAWRHLEAHARWLFPSLADARITHRWGGPFSLTLDLAPALGYLGDRRAVYSLGCIGHGVSMSHLNGQVIRDLLLERRSELIDSPFVERRVLPWPPEPFATAAAKVVRGYLRAEDWWHERHLVRGSRGSTR